MPPHLQGSWGDEGGTALATYPMGLGANTAPKWALVLPLSAPRAVRVGCLDLKEHSGCPFQNPQPRTHPIALASAVESLPEDSPALSFQPCRMLEEGSQEQRLGDVCLRAAGWLRLTARLWHWKG